jgi:hypothetical protein
VNVSDHIAGHILGHLKPPAAGVQPSIEAIGIDPRPESARILIVIKPSLTMTVLSQGARLRSQT